MYSRNQVWADFQAVLSSTPMFQKVRAQHPELGDALGPERDYSPYRVQFYAGGIIYARIGDWGSTWVATTRKALPAAEVSAKPVEVYQSPNHGGTRLRTDGVIIHSTRSGRFSRNDEYQKTINYMMLPNTVSSHRVIGVNEGQHAQMVAGELEAWHAKMDNLRWLGIELSQPLPTDPYTDYQYEVAAAVVREWAQGFDFPLDRKHVVGHEETEQGKRNGKSDPGKPFDWTRFVILLRG